MRTVLAVAVLAACHRDPTIAFVDDPPGPVDNSRQLVTAMVDDWHATHATLQLWESTRPGGPWHAVGQPWPGVIGHAGAAWPANRREGDGTSPAGVFPLGPVFGYAATPPAGARMPYTQTDATYRCIDDPASAHYGQILSTRDTSVDWSSAEDMRRDDALYTWVVEVGFNREHTPPGGSCIFLHVWKDADTPTVGCTAMPEDALASMIAALDPAAKPMFALLPRAEYDARVAGWGLPPR